MAIATLPGISAKHSIFALGLSLYLLAGLCCNNRVQDGVPVDMPGSAAEAML